MLMDPTEFEKSPSGFLMSTVYDQKAFMPNPLPPEVNLTSCMSAISMATMAIGELKGMSDKITNPTHLINPLQNREAIASSSIEGTYTTPSDLLLLNVTDAKSSDPDTREVRNYVTALQRGLKMLSDIPVSSRMIKELHQILLKGVTRSRGSNIIPGEYKTDQNFIGSQGRGISNARFVPPPPSKTLDLMSDLEKFINSEEANKLPPVVVNAYVHYQFETIHPFPDGNGRVGRLLLPILLASQGIMSTPLLYISPFIEKNKEEYNDSLLKVSREGSWENWITFFSRSIENSAKETIAKIDRLSQLKEKCLSDVQQARVSGLLPKLIEIIFDFPIITIPQAEAKLNVTYKSARLNIDKLIELGIMQEYPKNTRPKAFVCGPLLDLIFED